jgi:hypothetical protein
MKPFLLDRYPDIIEDHPANRKTTASDSVIRCACVKVLTKIEMKVTRRITARVVAQTIQKAGWNILTKYYMNITGA